MNALREFQAAGQDLFFGRLNNSHSGNMSIRINRMLAITRTGAMLHRLEFPDIVETPIAEDDLETPRASRELPVHRAIYLGTDAQAIVHAHPPHLVALSMVTDTIRPIDAEGEYYYPNGVPVLTVSQAVASVEVAHAVTPLLRTHHIGVVKGHGSFAVGRDLEEGVHWTSSLENSAQIVLLQRFYRHLPNLT